MKWYKRLKVFKASNVTYNPETKEAYSYGWWKFVTKVNGKIVFNDYSYSQSTRRHQSKVLMLMNYKYDLHVSLADGLQQSDWEKKALRVGYFGLFELEVKQSNPKRRNDYSTGIKQQKAYIEKMKSILKTRLLKSEIDEIQNRVFETEMERFNELEYKKGCANLDAKAPNFELSTSSWSGVPEHLRGQIVSKANFQKLVETQVLSPDVKKTPTYEDTTKANFNMDYVSKFESEVLA